MQQLIGARGIFRRLFSNAIQHFDNIKYSKVDFVDKLIEQNDIGDRVFFPDTAFNRDFLVKDRITYVSPNG